MNDPSCLKKWRFGTIMLRRNLSFDTKKIKETIWKKEWTGSFRKRSQKEWSGFWEKRRKHFFKAMKRNGHTAFGTIPYRPEEGKASFVYGSRRGFRPPDCVPFPGAGRDFSMKRACGLESTRSMRRGPIIFKSPAPCRPEKPLTRGPGSGSWICARLPAEKRPTRRAG